MAYSTINKGSDYFSTKLYTGNAGTNAITGVGFQPAFTWIKARSRTDNHVLVDALRGTNRVRSNTNGVQADVSGDGFTSLDSDGFTLNGSGGGGEFNANSATFVSWNWKAGTTSSISGGTITPSYVSISAASGFGIYTYTGTGSNATIAHGLGTAPSFIMIKQTNDTANWAIYYNPQGGTSPATQLNGQEGRYMSFQTSGFSTTSSVWNDTAATSSVFTVGTTALVNESGKTYVAYAFADVIGYQRLCGWYANADSNGPFLYTGFKPAFFMMFNINNSSRYMIADHKRSFYNEVDKKLRPQGTDVEATTGDIGCDFVSNGIKIRGGSTSDINHTNGNMMYGLAIAERPLVASNNVAATAR